MNPGATYALVTFLVGVMFLLGWLYATTGNPRSGAILAKSFLLFALPILFAPGAWVQLHLGMWVWVLCEESLKAFASTREQRPIDKFWLVALFGVWELTVDKPFWGLALAQSGEGWDRAAISGVIYATALAVLMHAVTAAIYAFTFERRLWAAFIASWVVHMAFNESVDYSRLSPAVAIAQTAILALMLTALILSWRRAAALKGP